MMRLTLCQLGVGIALAALSLGVPAQQPAAAAPTSTTGQHAMAGKHMTNEHKASGHAKATHGMRNTASAEGATADSPYKAALRRCVTGPESQRDSCLDQAIAQYGRA